MTSVDTNTLLRQNPAMGNQSKTIINNTLFTIILFLLCLLAFILRAWDPFERDVGTSDDQSYISIGQSLANGEGFSDKDPMLSPRTAWRAPLTSFVYAGCILASKEKSTFIFFLLQWLLGAGTTLFLVLIAFEIHGDKMSALLAGILYVFNPISINLANKVLSETIFIFLTMAALHFFIRAEKHEKSIFFLIAGLFTGFALLSRAALTLFLPVIVTYLLFVSFSKKTGTDKKIGIKNLLLYLFATIVVLSPWIIRNTMVNKTLTLITTNTGFNLYLDNVPDNDIWAEIKQKDQNEWANLTEGQRDRILLKRFISFAVNHPVTYAEKVGNRFWLMILEFKRIILPALVGIFLISFRFFRIDFPLLLLLSTLTVTYAVTYFNDRMGATIAPILIIYASYTILEPIRWFSQKPE